MGRLLWGLCSEPQRNATTVPARLPPTRRLEEGALVSKLIETVDRIHLLDGRCVTEGSGFLPAVGCPPASRHTPLSVGSSQLVCSLRPRQREMTSPVTKPPHGNDFPSPCPYAVGQKQVAVLHVQQEGLLKSVGHWVILSHFVSLVCSGLFKRTNTEFTYSLKIYYYYMIFLF